MADEDADAVVGMGVDGAEGGFVGDVVAEEGYWGIWVGLREDSGYGAAFVRAGAEFYAGFEFEEGEAVVAGEWREDGERFFADLGGFWCRGSAPVHDGGVGFVFKEAAEAVLVELGAELSEILERGFRELGEFSAAIGKEVFRAVEAPDFEMLQAEERGDFTGGAAGDEDDARTSLLDLREDFADTGPGVGLEAVFAEGREGAVVVEEEKRDGFGGEGAEEGFEYL